MHLPPTSSAYIQPTESLSTKSPLELLANACNKLETDMLGSKPSTFLHQEAKRPRQSPSPSRGSPASTPTSRMTSSPRSSSDSGYTSSHLPVRMAPIRSSSESIVLQKDSPRASPISSGSLRPPSTSSFVAQTRPPTEPLSLVSKPKVSPAPPKSASPKEPVISSSRSTPTRPEVGSLKIRSTASLSPVAAAKSPTSSAAAAGLSSTGAPTSGPMPAYSSLYTASMMGIPSSATMLGLPAASAAAAPGFLGLPGMPPVPGALPSSQAAMLPYLGLMGAAAGAAAPPPPTAGPLPCTDPLCRDPSCPTFAMRSAQQQLAGAGLPPYAYAGLHLGAPPGYPPIGFPPGLHPYAPYLASLAGQHPGAPPVSAAVTQPPMGVAGSPYLCSWMQGRDFCGRRFNTSEELMAHLRSHTASLGDAGAQPQHSPLGTSATPPSLPGPPPSALAILQAQAAQLRAQSSGSPRPASSASSSASPPGSSDLRYHPYSRAPPSATSSPLPPPHLTSPAAVLPPHLAASPLNPALFGSPRSIMPVLPT